MCEHPHNFLILKNKTIIFFIEDQETILNLKNFWKVGRRQSKAEKGGNKGGRITREQIGKWNQMTALRFQTGGKTSWPPFGAQLEKYRKRKHRVQMRNNFVYVFVLL